MYKERWQRHLWQPPTPLFPGKGRVTGSKEHLEVSRKAAEEGMVLLKNNGILPLKSGTRIAIFGQASYDIKKCGGGSGDVYVEHTYNLDEAFIIKERENGEIEVFEELCNFYNGYVKEKLKSLTLDWTGMYEIEEPEIPEDLLKKAQNFADVAIYTVSRYSCESFDRKSKKGDFFLTDKEQETVNLLTEKFKKVIVVLNVGGQIDAEWFSKNDKICATLLAWQAGSETAKAVANILCGDVNPSGKLADTFANTFDDYPSSYNFNESIDYVEYTDDIYVGYRYFETVPGAKEKVAFPFGFGLSYTTFDIENVSAKDDGETVTVKATVTNTGMYPGKEVIQVYASMPQGKLGKPARNLVAFRKTRELKVGETQVVYMSFKINDLASYDDTGKVKMSAYILEKGDYNLYVGTDVRTAEKIDYKYTVSEDYIVVKQLTQRAAPSMLKKRLLPDGSFEDMPSYNLEPKYKKSPVNSAKPPETLAKFIDVAEGRVTMDEFLAQFTDLELCNFLGGQEKTGMSDTRGIGNIERLGIPNVQTEDGPAGVRLNKSKEFATCFPCAILLSCTWNPEIIYEVGVAAGNETKECNFAVWLAPALNIHRNPLCGRNFEYFSEDPLVSGKCAAAMVSGVQSTHASATIKHFACNNKENNRLFSDSRVSERALREIYIKGFEICIKEAEPWAVMTCYNKVNGTYPSENYDFVTGFLREEWGYNGLVMTDWCCASDQVKEIKAGNDLKMPWGNFDKEIYDEWRKTWKRFPELEATIGSPDGWVAKNLKEGNISRADLELSAKNILNLLLKLD